MFELYLNSKPPNSRTRRVRQWTLHVFQASKAQLMGSCQLLQLPPEQQLQPLIMEPEALPVFSLDAVSYRVTRSVGTTDAGDTIYVSGAAAATATPAVGLLSLDHDSSQFQVKGFCFIVGFCRSQSFASELGVRIRIRSLDPEPGGPKLLP
jgi:hypothetical protein